MFEWQTIKLKGRTQPIGEEFGIDGNAEDLISYCARVSNPANQDNFDTAGGLLKYCIKKKHWSIFEMADLIMEIKTTRDIGRQILRHKSFSFQEFSQRYAEVTDNFTDNYHREGRLQDTKNRQNSIKINDLDLESEWIARQIQSNDIARMNYEWAIKKGLAKECARVVLPEGLTLSTMYMKGNLRNWFHYTQLRKIEGETQLEHVDIANKIWDIIRLEFPFLVDIEMTMENEAIKNAIKLLESKGYIIQYEPN